MKGLFNTGTTTVSPQQVLNYVSCHDNYTLFDQLIQTNKNNRNFDNMYSQAEAVVFTSQGIAFMQEGEDFLRTKEYEDEGKTKYSGNSYNVGDFINNMDYDLKIKNLKMFETFKEMIKVRKLTPELRLSTREEINNKVAIAKNDATTGNITFNIKKTNDTSKNILVIHALNAFEHSAVNGTILFDNTATFAPNSAINGAINLIDNQTLIIALNN
jgi:pullulanase